MSTKYDTERVIKAFYKKKQSSKKTPDVQIVKIVIDLTADDDIEMPELEYVPIVNNVPNTHVEGNSN
jgi:hypothetical protein